MWFRFMFFGHNSSRCQPKNLRLEHVVWELITDAVIPVSKRFGDLRFLAWPPFFEFWTNLAVTFDRVDQYSWNAYYWTRHHSLYRLQLFLHAVDPYGKIFFERNCWNFTLPAAYHRWCRRKFLKCISLDASWCTLSIGKDGFCIRPLGQKLQGEMWWNFALSPEVLGQGWPKEKCVSRLFEKRIRRLISA